MFYSTILAYALCALTATGAMLNLISFAVHIWMIRSPHNGLVHHGLILLDSAYLTMGMAIVLLILQADLKVDTLCAIGGFATVFTLLLVPGCKLVCSISTFLQQMPAIRKHRRYTCMFWLLAVTFILITAIISLLPFTKAPVFGNIKYSTFDCVPFYRLPVNGAGFSLFIIILYISAIITTVLFCVISITRIKRKEKRRQLLTKDRSFGTPVHSRNRSTDLLSIAAVLCIECFIWSVIFIPCILYLSEILVMDQTVFQWIVGYCAGAQLLVHPVLLFAAQKRKLSCGQSIISVQYADEHVAPSCGTFPHKLEGLKYLVNGEEDISTTLFNLSYFWVQWSDVQLSTQHSGIMRVYPPSERGKWDMEVKVMKKVKELGGHLNIDEYMWASSTNGFVSAISTATGKAVSLNSSLLCSKVYPHGSLRRYLTHAASSLTDISLHKMALDITQGLIFLHNLGIGHNALTSHTTFVAALSERVGVRLVLSNFGSSAPLCAGYNTSTGSPSPLHLHSSAKSINKDISSVFLVLLELLAAVNKSGYKRILKRSARKSTKSQDVPRAASVDIEMRPPSSVSSDLGSNLDSKSQGHISSSQGQKVNEPILDATQKMKDVESIELNNNVVSHLGFGPKPTDPILLSCSKLINRPLPPVPEVSGIDDENDDDETKLKDSMKFCAAKSRPKKMPCIREHEHEVTETELGDSSQSLETDGVRSHRSGLGYVHRLRDGPQRPERPNHCKRKQQGSSGSIDQDSDFESQNYDSSNAPSLGGKSWQSAGSLDESHFSFDSGISTAVTYVPFDVGSEESVFIPNIPGNRDGIYSSGSPDKECTVHSIFQSVVLKNAENSTRSKLTSMESSPSTSDESKSNSPPSELYFNMDPSETGENSFSKPGDNTYEVIGISRSKPSVSTISDRCESVDSTKSRTDISADRLGGSASTLFDGDSSMGSIVEGNFQRSHRKCPNLGVAAVRYRQSKLSLQSQDSQLVNSREELSVRGQCLVYGARQATYCRELGSVYTAVKSEDILRGNVEAVSQMLDHMRSSKNTGYTAEQLCNLLKKFWLTDFPQTLVPLHQAIVSILPSASV